MLQDKTWLAEVYLKLCMQKEGKDTAAISTYSVSINLHFDSTFSLAIYHNLSQYFAWKYAHLTPFNLVLFV